MLLFTLLINVILFTVISFALPVKREVSSTPRPKLALKPNHQQSPDPFLRTNNPDRIFIDPGPPGICGNYNTHVPNYTRPPTQMDWTQCRKEDGLGWFFEGHCYGMAGATHPNLKVPTMKGLCHFSNRLWRASAHPSINIPPMPQGPPPPVPGGKKSGKKG